MPVSIAALTDSLGLPRGGSEATPPRQTWPALLRESVLVDDVTHVGIGGATVTQLAGQLSYAIAAVPDVLVVQCGIVDCAPRALRQWERQALQQVPGGRRVARAIEKRAVLLRRWRDIAFTSPSTFRDTCRTIVARAGASRPLWVGIVDAGDEARVPGIRARIRSYNGILRDTVGTGFVDVGDMPVDGVCADHHHLTAAGHAFVATKLLERIAAHASPAR